MLRGRSLGQAIGVVALLGATFGVSTASAQVDYEIMASLQFNFSNPGARSLAMAGALTGAGDDATGAWTNPGGLTNITRPEVGVEFRGFDFETPFVNGGRFNGTPTQHRHRHGGRTDLRQLGQLDAQPVVRLGGRAQVPLRLRVLPHRSRQLRDRHPDGRTVLRSADRCACTPSSPIAAPRLARSSGNLDLQISNFGGSAAVRLTDQVSVGVGVSFYDFELDSTNRRFGLDRRPPDACRAASSARRSYRRDQRGRHRVHPGRGHGVRRQHRRVDQPERQVPHRRQLPPGAEVRHRLPARGLGRRADQRQRRASSTCPTSSPSACWSSRSSALNLTVDWRRGSVLAADQRHGASASRSRTSPLDDYVLDDGNEIRVAGEYLFTEPAVAAVRHRDPRRRLARPRSPHPLRRAVPERTPCSIRRATAKCTTPAAAASCSRSSSSTSASIAPRR